MFKLVLTTVAAACALALSAAFSMSCVAVVRKARIGFASNLRTNVGNSCPPRKATQLPLAA